MREAAQRFKRPPGWAPAMRDYGDWLESLPWDEKDYGERRDPALKYPVRALLFQLCNSAELRESGGIAGAVEELLTGGGLSLARWLLRIPPESFAERRTLTMREHPELSGLLFFAETAPDEWLYVPTDELLNELRLATGAVTI